MSDLLTFPFGAFYADHTHGVSGRFLNRFLRSHSLTLYATPQSCERNTEPLCERLNRDLTSFKKDSPRLTHVPELLSMCDKGDVFLLIVSININPLDLQTLLVNIPKVFSEVIERFISFREGNSTPSIMRKVRSTRVGASAFHSPPASPHGSEFRIGILAVCPVFCDTFCRHFSADAPTSENASTKVGSRNFFRCSAITKAHQVFGPRFTYRLNRESAKFKTDQFLDRESFLEDSFFSHNSKSCFGLRLGPERGANRIRSEMFTPKTKQVNE